MNGLAVGALAIGAGTAQASMSEASGTSIAIGAGLTVLLSGAALWHAMRFSRRTAELETRIEKLEQK